MSFNIDTTLATGDLAFWLLAAAPATMAKSTTTLQFMVL